MTITSASVFVDTSGWASVIHRQDPFHSEAERIYLAAFGSNRGLVTTDYVLSELTPLLGSHYKMARSTLLAAVDAILTDPHIAVQHTDSATFDAAWLLLKQRPDKEWSLVDGISFVVMQRLGLHEALTSDHHFEQAQYIRLLR